jgi:competence protein ComEC
MIFIWFFNLDYRWQNVMINSKVITLLFAFIFCVIPFSTYASDYLKLIALDVGEGLAVLLVKNNRGLLIDTGLPEEGPSVLRKLKKYRVYKLDKLILTHLHPDHAGGALMLKKSFPKLKLYESGHRSGSPLEGASYQKLVSSFDSSFYPKTIVRQSDEVCWQAVQLQVLWPSDITDGTVNSNSLVLRINYLNRSVLIMGDAGIEVEKKLINTYLQDSEVDLLIVGHHGARDSTSMAFLQAIQPTEAVISVDRNNKNGYPDQGVVKRLKKLVAKVSLLYETGDYEFDIKGKELNLDN